jgi:hypothetical protein
MGISHGQEQEGQEPIIAREQISTKDDDERQ